MPPLPSYIKSFLCKPIIPFESIPPCLTTLLSFNHFLYNEIFLVTVVVLCMLLWVLVSDFVLSHLKFLNLWLLCYLFVILLISLTKHLTEQVRKDFFGSLFFLPMNLGRAYMVLRTCSRRKMFLLWSSRKESSRQEASLNNMPPRPCLQWPTASSSALWHKFPEPPKTVRQSGEQAF